MARYWQPGDPLQSTAVCDPIQSAQLLEFDHHQVMVDGVWGILLTYPWMLADETTQSTTQSMKPNMTHRIATVVFNPAPNHVATTSGIQRIIRQHPLAPPPIQTIIDHLAFRPSVLECAKIASDNQHPQ